MADAPYQPESRSYNSGMLNFTNIQSAAARLEGVAHRTPVLTSTTLNCMLGCEVFMKAENLSAHGHVQVAAGLQRDQCIDGRRTGKLDGTWAISSSLGRGNLIARFGTS